MGKNKNKDDGTAAFLFMVYVLTDPDFADAVRGTGEAFKQLIHNATRPKVEALPVCEHGNQMDATCRECFPYLHRGA